MSRPVRIKEYLAIELEKIAAREDRSLANLVNKLLEQAIEMDNKPLTLTTRAGAGVIAQTTTTPAQLREMQRTEADAESRDVRARTVEPSEVKPDFKKEKKR